jgi:gliding motility-associated protein GldM
MMTKTKFAQKTKLRILALVPVLIILFLGVSCIKGGDKSNPVTAVELVKMNVIYLGVENPVKIASSGYETSELDASIDNGTIYGRNGEYMILPKETGMATLTISSKGKEIQKAQFRVKVVPDPIAGIKILNGNSFDYISSGTITKKDLLTAGGISVEMRNFDFDLEFKIVSFVVSGVFKGGYEETEFSKSDRFTDKQIVLLERLIKNQKLLVEEIIAIGPEGKERKLNSMMFNVNIE